MVTAASISSRHAGGGRRAHSGGGRGLELTRPGGRPVWERLSPGGDDKVQHVHNDKSALQGQPTQPGAAMASHGAVCSEAHHAATVSTPVIATPLAAALPHPSRHDAGGPHDACGQQAMPWVTAAVSALASKCAFLTSSTIKYAWRPSPRGTYQSVGQSSS